MRPLLRKRNTDGMRRGHAAARRERRPSAAGTLFEPALSASCWSLPPLARDFPVMQLSPFPVDPTDLLVLLVLRRARLHGWGITLRLQQLTRDVVQLDERRCDADRDDHQ